MPKCIACKEKWTWKQSMRSLVILSRFISCPYCAKKQMFTSMTRISILLLMFVPYITMPYVINDEVKSSAVAIGIAIYLLALLLMMPFLMDLREIPKHLQKYAQK
ncbi:TIGR04104 family putative zinc finger protein [Lysinibacillus sp. NPDC097195]|uniref:TIGR04104 family putative zinc finger protein n=1 Tax=Lysinibacillus sp. NPDC097195 TaxID=3364141 RepID=UPI00382EA3D4